MEHDIVEKPVIWEREAFILKQVSDIVGSPVWRVGRGEQLRGRDTKLEIVV